MSQPVLFSILESSAHPQMSDLYRQKGFEELKFTSQRKAISKLKHISPEVIVAEFFYGYGNNYAGVNVSNLDTLLASLQRYSPDTRVIVVVSKAEAGHVAKLQKLFPLHAVLQHPVSRDDMEAALQQ
jgi:DNA-binding NarL/FixJ family response regulator